MDKNDSEQQRSTKLQSKSVSQILQNIKQKKQNSQKLKNESQNDDNCAYIQQDNYKYSQKVTNNKAHSLESRLGQFSPYKQANFFQKKRFSGEDNNNKQVSDLSNKSSSEKYKTLVESNNRKNYQIWIKSDSVIRIPKNIRASQENTAQIKDETSINQKFDNEDQSASEKDQDKKFSNSQKDLIIRLSVRETALAQNKYGFPRDKTHIAQQIQKTQFDTCDLNTSRHPNIVSLSSQKDDQLEVVQEQTMRMQKDIKNDKMYFDIQNSLKSFNKQLVQEEIQNQMNDYCESLILQKDENINHSKNQQKSMLQESNSEVIMKDIGGTQIFIESAKFSENKFNSNFLEHRDSRFGNQSSEINQSYPNQIFQQKKSQQQKQKKQNVKTKLVLNEMKEEINASDQSQMTDQTIKINQIGSHKNLDVQKRELIIFKDEKQGKKNQKRKNKTINSKNLSIDLNQENRTKVQEVKENKNILNELEERKKNKTQLSPIKSQLVKIQKQTLQKDEKSSSATISVHLNYKDIDLNNNSKLEPEIKRPCSGQQQYDSDQDRDILENKKSGFDIKSHINATTSQDTIINSKPQPIENLKFSNNFAKIIEPTKVQQFILQTNNYTSKQQIFKMNSSINESQSQIQINQKIKNTIPLPTSKNSNLMIDQKNRHKMINMASDANLILKQTQIKNLLQYELESHDGTERTAGHHSSQNSIQKQNIDSIKLEKIQDKQLEIKIIPQNQQIQNNKIQNIKENQKQILNEEVKKEKIILDPIQVIKQKKLSISKYVQTQDFKKVDQAIQISETFKVDQAIQKNSVSDRTQSKQVQQKQQLIKSQNSQFYEKYMIHNKINYQLQDSQSLKNNFTPIAQTIQSEEPIKNNDLLSMPVSQSISNHPYFKSEGGKIDSINFQNAKQAIDFVFNANHSDHQRDLQSQKEKEGQQNFVQIIDKDYIITQEQQKQEPEPSNENLKETIDVNQQLQMIQCQDQKDDSKSKDIISTSQSAIFGKISEYKQIQQSNREKYIQMEKDMNKTISSKDDDNTKLKIQDLVKEQISLTTRIKLQNVIGIDHNSICEQSAYKSQQTVNFIMPHNQDSIFRNNYHQDSIQQSSAMVSSTINLIQEHNVNFQNCINFNNDDAIINGDSYFMWANQDNKHQSIEIDNQDHKFQDQKRFKQIKQKKQLESTKVPIINIQANVIEKIKKSEIISQKETGPKIQNNYQNNEQQQYTQNNGNSNINKILYNQKSDQKSNDQLSQINILTTGSPQNESKISELTRFKNQTKEKSILASSYNMNKIIEDSRSIQRNQFPENLNNSQQSNRSTYIQNIKNNENYYPVNSSNELSSFMKNRDLKKFQLQSLNQYYNSNKNRIKDNVFSESGGDNYRNSQKNRYSRKILSVEPAPNQFGFNSNDFQKNMILRQDQGEFSSKNTLKINDQIKLEPLFNLKTFIRKNNLQKVLINDFSQNSSIYDFHKNNIYYGAQKNQGPVENQLEIVSSKRQSLNYKLDNFKNQVKQFAQNKNYSDKNYQVQIKNKENSNSSRKRQSSNNPNEFDEALGNGLINIEQAFMLIQYIKRSQGIPVMSELEIVDFVANQRSLNLDNNYFKNIDINSQIKKYKWREVMKFMKANPHVLMQLLSLNEIGNKNMSTKQDDELNIPNTQAIKNQKEIQARQRYTDIVLNNMKSRVPPIFIQQQRQQGFLKKKSQNSFQAQLT